MPETHDETTFPLDLARYRPNVGIILARDDGKVWLGRRADTPGPRNWQFPQGGVDEGEALEAAARRELQEETGATSVTLLGQTADWIAYSFPAGYRRSKAARGWLGQKQIWFAFLFTGDESEFNLSAHDQIEFDRWRWAALDEAMSSVADFKRETYGHVIETFRPLITPRQNPGPAGPDETGTPRIVTPGDAVSTATSAS